MTETGFNNQDTWGIRDFFVAGNELFVGTNGGWQYPARGAQNPTRRAGWQLIELYP